jgi:hypothetical protein
MSQIVIDIVDSHSSNGGFGVSVCSGVDDGDGFMVLVLVMVVMVVVMSWC